MPAIPFACPCCRAPLQQITPDEVHCAVDGLRFIRQEGIWRFLLPGRSAYFEKFTREYETVRRAEGRGSQDPAYYRSLPYRDLSGRMPAAWGIRAASFDMFVKKVLRPLEGSSRQLQVLDLGAGNCWLTNRLAGRGHALIAVDLMSNDFDGLGCRRFYETGFISVQAEFDRLPIEDNTIDLVIFNASLHYSINIRDTLAESLRVLAGTGVLVVLDSPVYRDADSGAQMVQERENQFVKQFGFPSNALVSENYLTHARLDELAAALGLKWQFFTPYYGFKWAMRPFLSKIRGDREPARFHVIVGSR